jgi:hypothetical protein
LTGLLKALVTRQEQVIADTSIMAPRHPFIGRLRHEVDSRAAEYQRLAEEDEAVGRLLPAQNRSRHAAYWFVQAMEKVLCSKIFKETRRDSEPSGEEAVDQRRDSLSQSEHDRDRRRLGKPPAPALRPGSPR